MKRLGLSYDHLFGIRFAIIVAIASTIVWWTLRLIGDTNPIWAIASMVAASDPQPDEARRMFKARLSNVLVGCFIGLAFLLVGGAKAWLLPIAMAVAVLVSSFIVRIKTMWRQAPITAAVVIGSGSIESSSSIGILQGLHKVGDVIFGCLIGLLVSWIMSKVWIVQIPKK
jgi:uncharacterized membrane protein YccC